MMSNLPTLTQYAGLILIACGLLFSAVGVVDWAYSTIEGNTYTSPYGRTFTVVVRPLGWKRRQTPPPRDQVSPSEKTEESDPKTR